MGTSSSPSSLHNQHFFQPAPPPCAKCSMLTRPPAAHVTLRHSGVPAAPSRHSGARCSPPAAHLWCSLLTRPLPDSHLAPRGARCSLVRCPPCQATLEGGWCMRICRSVVLVWWLCFPRRCVVVRPAGNALWYPLLESCSFLPIKTRRGRNPSLLPRNCGSPEYHTSRRLYSKLCSHSISHRQRKHFKKVYQSPA
jgi:hypothetical protein